MSESSKLPIIGRERMLIDKLAQKLQRSIETTHGYTTVRQEPRGSYFEVMMYDGKEQTDRIARVTVEMDRIAKEF
jgi:hypothetical protein